MFSSTLALFARITMSKIDSTLRSRQGWKDLLQRVFNHPINEYRYDIEEYERIYHVHSPSFLCLPNQGIIDWNILPLAAIVHYWRIENEKASIIVIPSFDEGTERTKSLSQKRVTSNRFFLDHFAISTTIIL